MQVAIDREEAVIVVRPRGRLDAVHGPALDEAIQGVLAQGSNRFVIDMAEVDYISSAGLGVLLKSAKSARAAGGRIAISGLADAVNRALDMSGFLTLFAVHETAASAVAELAADGGDATC